MTFAGVDKSKLYEYQRTSLFMLYGFMYQGPAVHLSYNYIIPYLVPGKCMVSLAKKLVMTQTFFAFAAISSFYLFMGMG